MFDLLSKHDPYLQFHSHKSLKPLFVYVKYPDLIHAYARACLLTVPSRETDLPPTPLANEPIPKGIARILGAESVRKAYRARRAEEAGNGGRGTATPKSSKEGVNRPKEEGIRPGETLREYNRYMRLINLLLDRN